MPDVSTVANSPQTTTLTTDGSLTLLQAGGSGVVAFNQGLFGSGPNSKLPINAADGSARTIRGSGCGLCALVSYLATAGCLVPTYDSDSQTFSIADGAKRIDPASFNHYLKQYVAANSLPLGRIFAPDGQGALVNGSGDLVLAMNALVDLIQPDDAPATDIDIGGATAITARAAVGTEIPDLTSQIDSGDPAIIGVNFAGDGPNAGHQILAVGYARFGGEVFYVVVDSGFGHTDPYPTLLNMSDPVHRASVLPYCASKARATKYSRIIWYRKLRGLQTLTGLSAAGSSDPDQPPPSSGPQ